MELRLFYLCYAIKAVLCYCRLLLHLVHLYIESGLEVLALGLGAPQRDKGMLCPVAFKVCSSVKRCALKIYIGFT